MSASAPLAAQSLQRLSVESFALSCDTTTPRVDQPFQLVVSLRVKEPVSEIDNLVLPSLAQLEVQGDTRQTVAGPHGTQYRETIQVVAHAPATIVIGPATLQAVDARDGKAKQWSTNGLMLRIGIAPSQIVHRGATVLWTAVKLGARIVLVLAGVICLVVIAVLIARKPRRVTVAVAPPAAVSNPVAPLERTYKQRIEDALTVLRAEPTRPTAVRVRAAVWRLLGATEGETLADVLRRPGSNEALLRGALISLERSAFTYDADLHAAIDDACGALQRYVDSLT